MGTSNIQRQNFLCYNEDQMYKTNQDQDQIYIPESDREIQEKIIKKFSSKNTTQSNSSIEINKIVEKKSINFKQHPQINKIRKCEKINFNNLNDTNENSIQDEVFKNQFDKNSSTPKTLDKKQDLSSIKTINNEEFQFDDIESLEYYLKSEKEKYKTKDNNVNIRKIERRNKSTGQTKLDRRSSHNDKSNIKEQNRLIKLNNLKNLARQNTCYI